MSLTKKDKLYLTNCRYHEEDIKRIESVLNTCKIFIFINGRKVNISNEKARKMLGEEQFLDGIIRCTFNDIAVRSTSDGYSVLFDCSSMIK